MGVVGSITVGRFPMGRFLMARFPMGMFPMGQVPSGHVPNGQVPNGQVPNGQVIMGWFPMGRYLMGRHPIGRSLMGIFWLVVTFLLPSFILGLPLIWDATTHSLHFILSELRVEQINWWMAATAFGRVASSPCFTKCSRSRLIPVWLHPSPSNGCSTKVPCRSTSSSAARSPL